jgi:NADPH:quinone reductase-like Zn-dependent oxidoreductase
MLMKAVVYERYGSPDVLELKEIARPAVKDDEVLVRIHAAAANAYDLHYLQADPFFIRLMGAGLLKPKNTRLGADIAGRVEAVGPGVTQFQPGDEVFGDIAGCGAGGFAEYVSVPETKLALKPANVTFEEAAAVPMAALTALQGLRDRGQVQPGQKVLINGASGGVGTFAVQVAKLLGGEVTAVCSPRNVDQAHRLGADAVIDYTQEDCTRNGQRYDVIFAANGYHSIFDYRRALSPSGVLVGAGGSMGQIFQVMLLGPRLSKTGGQRLAGFLAREDQQDLVAIKGYIEAGKLKPVVDRCYPLSETAEALRYLGEGHARGKVVITVAPD